MEGASRRVHEGGHGGSLRSGGPLVVALDGPLYSLRPLFNEVEKKVEDGMPRPDEVGFFKHTNCVLLTKLIIFGLSGFP